MLLKAERGASKAKPVGSMLMLSFTLQSDSASCRWHVTLQGLKKLPCCLCALLTTWADVPRTAAWLCRVIHALAQGLRSALLSATDPVAMTRLVLLHIT